MVFKKRRDRDSHEHDEEAERYSKAYGEVIRATAEIIEVAGKIKSRYEALSEIGINEDTVRAAIEILRKEGDYISANAFELADKLCRKYASSVGLSYPKCFAGIIEENFITLDYGPESWKVFKPSWFKGL